MKAFIQNWGYKAYIQYFLPIKTHPIKTISIYFAILGGYYTVCEIEQSAFQSQYFIGVIREYTIPFLVVIALITVLLLRQKDEYSTYLGKRDTIISIKLGNLLSLKHTAIVIPTNTTFDTVMHGEFISIGSIQGQFQKKYYGIDFSELDKSIKFSLDQFYGNNYTELSDRTKSNRNRYDIGTVAKICINNQHFYFLAVADVSKTGKTENVSMQNMIKALVGLWDYLSIDGHTEPITIPVIGTGRGGLRDGTLEDVVHETIFSFISKSNEEFVSNKMTVCIYPPTLSSANANWIDLCDYLKWQCKYCYKDNERRNPLERTGKAID